MGLKPSERGAVAVEMAILLPILLLMVLGIIEFGRALNAQITLTNAAREGVRVMAIGNDDAVARQAAQNAAVILNPPLNDDDIDIVAACSDPANQVTMTISYHLDTITGITGPFSMTGKGVMSCGG